MMFVTSNMRIRSTFVLIVAIALHQICTAEVFTSISEMEELLDSHSVLINNLEAYVAAHEDKLDYLRRRISKYQREHDEAVTDVGKYVSNPINAYLLTKRLTSDWSILESVMSHDIAKAFLENVTMHRDIMKFPSNEDLTGAAVALIRLQDTYNLDTAGIARGELNGSKCSSEMTAHDCFEMGRQSYMYKEYAYSLMWMNEAMARLDKKFDEIKNVPKKDILEYLDFADEQLKASTDKAPNDTEEEKLINVAYKKLCRGDSMQDPKLLSQLKCRYVSNNSPFLKIAPFKLEEANLKPYIVVYHDVMYDREIEKIREKSKSKFNRASVIDSDGKSVSANYRIAKTAWLTDSDYDEILQPINQRIEDMTGLTISTAEDFQIGNYGIGGHYEPHIDFAPSDDEEPFDDLGTGNRIATVLFYLSDVAQGGATVFPSINVALWPQKGSAAFWYNLYASGEGDYNTLHAACPVLAGSKWVGNKWFHQYGQEFLRPCEIEPDHPNNSDFS